MSSSAVKPVNNTAVKPTNVRWVGSVIMFIFAMVCYLDRLVFSVGASPIMRGLSLTPVQFGMIISIFSIGYFVFQIPGGIACQYKGPRVIISSVLIVWSLLTAATGLVYSMVSMAVVRFFFGVSESPVMPAANQWIANWLAKGERGRGSALLNGGCYSANIFGPPFVVLIMTMAGWRVSFFVCGALGIIVGFVWFFFTRSKPTEHPGVNAQELAIINENGTAAGATTKISIPWGYLLKQRSFWGVAFGGFGTLWNVQFFNYWLPYYLQAAKGLSFKSMGYYTSVPWIFIVAAVFGSGALSDFLIKKGLSRFWARNMMCVIGLALSAVALIASTHAKGVVADIIWLSLALGFAGVAQSLNWAIITEIGQDLTSIVTSWMNTWGFIAATIVPTVAPLVAKNYGWNQVLILNACVMLIGIIGFLMVKTDTPLIAPTNS